jgi:hypothetical protein
MAKLNYYVLAYSLIVIIIIFSTLNFLYRSERIFASVIVLILFILIFVFFGLRWFRSGVVLTGTHQGNWPPVVNSCPDYLTLFKRTDGTYTCVDVIGVSYNNSVQQWISGLTPPVSIDDKHYFKYVHTPSDKVSVLNTLRQQANNKGLTWEGITDDNYTLWDSVGATPSAPKCTP